MAPQRRGPSLHRSRTMRRPSRALPLWASPPLAGLALAAGAVGSLRGTSHGLASRLLLGVFLSAAHARRHQDACRPLPQSRLTLVSVHRHANGETQTVCCEIQRGTRWPDCKEGPGQCHAQRKGTAASLVALILFIPASLPSSVNSNIIHIIMLPSDMI